MKPLLSILLICSIGFTQELTVDGNLNVTGNIQNQTIDSLLQVIQDLQNQLSLLQVENRLETRVFEIGVLFNGTIIDFNEILGYEFNYFILEILNATPINFTPTQSYNFSIQNSSFSHFGIARGSHYPYNLNTFTWEGAGQPTRGLFIDNGDDIIFVCPTGSWNVTISITTQFPSESNTLLQDNSVLTKDKNGQ